MYFKVMLGFLLLLAGQYPIANHAIYLSVVEIDDNSMAIKVFSDDLKDVIRNYSEKYVASSLEDLVTNNQEVVNAYFNDSFALEFNDEKQTYRLVSSKQESDAHFLYFSLNFHSELKKMKLEGGFFTELFPDQSNVITVIKDDKKYYARLTKSNPMYVLTFD